MTLFWFGKDLLMKQLIQRYYMYSINNMFPPLVGILSLLKRLMRGIGNKGRGSWREDPVRRRYWKFTHLILSLQPTNTNTSKYLYRRKKKQLTLKPETNSNKFLHLNNGMVGIPFSFPGVGGLGLRPLVAVSPAFEAMTGVGWNWFGKKWIDLDDLGVS